MSEQDLSKNEIERRARLKASRIRMIRNTFIWLLVVAAIAGAGYWVVMYSKKAESNKPGEAIAELGRNHIAVGAEHEQYNSNPPTSGSHYEQWAKWGIYEQQLPDEQLIHNLEHGGIWISYKDKDNREIFDQLKDVAEDYSIKIILTHRPENDSPIAVAAWTRLLKMDNFDEKQIRNFIKAFINKGPEQVPF
ncbi:MAG: DUF3105 domain-containing protein [bacterium]|nr:DUF3105 domain-containing protein [bacterium]